MREYIGLVEMLLLFGLVFGWAFWQWWDYRRWKRRQKDPGPPP